MNDLTAPPSPALTLSQAVRIAEIHPSPTNPRKTFPEAEQGELIESVKRHGVMQPILVRPWPAAYACEGEQPRYELIAGERRFRAARAAGLEFIPATVRDLDDHETLELQIVENLHRKDLNELEEAEGYELMTKQYGYTAEQLAEKIGKSKAYIYARLKLTAAGAAARAAFRDGKLDASRLLLVARIPTATLQQQAVEMLTSREHLATYRAAAQYVQTNYMLKLAEAPFPRGDADLLPAAGKCHPCPKRTGSQPALYPDVKSADICTDPECFAAKKAAHFARLKSEAKAQGRPVIEGAAAKKLMPYESADIKGYVKLDGKCYDAYDKETERYPTYRELLAERALPITLVETPDGNVIEAVEQKAFQAIATEVGVRKPASTGNEDQKKREAEAKEETLVRQRIHAQIRAATQEDIAERGPALEPEELRLVARQYFAATWHENQKRLARLWIESEEKIADSERIGILTTLIDNMTPDQACLFLMDLALIGMTHCGPWDKTETPAPLLATANRLNISVDTIRRQVKADGKAKGQKNKAPTATEAPPPATAETPAPTTTGLKTGDRVRVKPDATRDGFRVGNAGQEGTVHHTDPDEDDIYVAIDGDDRQSIYRFDELELIPLAIQVDEPAVVRSKRTAEMVAYIHPDHADLCWSGRGKKPKWVEHWLAEGGALEELKPPLRDATRRWSSRTLTPPRPRINNRRLPVLHNIKPLCIYHSPCIDGTAGAWVVRQALGDQVEFLPAAYGDAPPAAHGRDVILVDFSFKREPLLGLIEQARSVLVIDHHKSAQEDLIDLPGNVVCLFDMERSGARLAWDHFFPGQQPPLLLDHVQDRDLWRFELPMTRAIMAAVFSYPATIEAFDELQRRPLRELEQEGVALERKHQKDIDALLKACTRPMTIGGHTVPAANLPYTMASDAAGQLAENMPFAATYYDTDGERVFSLRSRPGGLDVSDIARQYGGGGHRHAAGFRVPLSQAGVYQVRLAERHALPMATPEAMGVSLTPADFDRLESTITRLQAVSPALDIDDCINLIFITGLAMTESPGGIDVVKSYAQLIQAAKEAA